MHTKQIGWLVAVLALQVHGGGGSGVASDGARAHPRRPAAIETQEIPAVPDELAERLRQYLNLRSAGFAGWAPDGNGVLIQTRFGNAAQVHRVYEPAGRREQMTFFDEPVRGRFIPNGSDGAVLLSMGRGGDENYQVYRFDPDAGRTVLLTDGQSRNLLGPLSDDGTKMVVANNARNGRDTDLWIADPRRAGSLQSLLETDQQYWYASDWSADGTQLLINHYVSITETYPAVLDARSGTKRMIPIPGGATASFGDLEFGLEGRFAYVSTDARAEFLELAKVDLPTGNYRWLSGMIPWDVEDIEIDSTTGRVVFTVNEDGASSLYELRDGQPVRLKIPLGIASGLEFSPDAEHLGFTLSRPDSPDDVYSLSLQEERVTRWTYSEVGGLNPKRFVRPGRIRYPTFDGRTIPAYYYKPEHASTEHPAAVLIHIHGGPESQYRPRFSGQTQFYVNELGIAVLAPNVRGSAGYGKSYLKLDNAERREDSVRDIGALLDWIAEQPELDPRRVAVIGGSYGGYMVLGSLVHFGDRIKAGVDIVGIASFTTFLERTSPYRQDLRRAEYGDERDPEMRAVFERINPTSRADEIRSALLVAHGKNDPRVPFFEAEQIAQKVRDAGRTVWTLYADNEGHGFRKKENRDYLAAVIAMFLREHLKAQE